MKRILVQMERDSQKIKTEIKLDEIKTSQEVAAVCTQVELLKEGTYMAITESATYLENVPTKIGLTSVIDLELGVYVHNSKFGSIEKEQLRERYFVSANEKSKFNQHIGTLAGKDARYGFNTLEIVGKMVEIVVKHNTSKNGDRTYANIDSIRLLDKSSIKEVI